MDLCVIVVFLTAATVILTTKYFDWERLNGLFDFLELFC